MSRKPHTAMLLAAGLGTRMRPLTDTCPKPLIKVRGKALIDYLLDAVREAGLKRVVVNVHYLPEMIEDHCKTITDLDVVISDERDELLETGGAIVKALPLLGEEPVVMVNTDAFWVGARENPIARLMQAYRPDDMDDLLLLARRDESLGFHGAGDFHLETDGRIRRRGDDPSADHAYAGVRITKPVLYEHRPCAPFSANLVWQESLKRRRLFGLPLNAFWMHVGDPQARDDAERYLETALGVE